MNSFSLPRKLDGGIAYYEGGGSSISGDTVSYLLLHGLGNSLDFWAIVAPALNGKRRTVAVDMPGFGKSPKPVQGFSLENLSSAINDFCERINLSECVIVAHSLGSFVALRLAALSSERFRRIILVDGTLMRVTQIVQSRGMMKDPALAFYVSTQFLGGALPIRSGITRLIGRSKIIRNLTLWPYVENPGQLDPEVLAAALSDNGGTSVLKVFLHSRYVDYGALMKNVNQPVDLVWGAKDRLINSDDVKCAKANMNVERTLEISDCGHWPMIENPAALCAFILAADLGQCKLGNIAY